MIMGKRTFRILDLFCGAGGCSMGYFAAAVEHFDRVVVTGVDLAEKNYPTYLEFFDSNLHFVRADALAYLRALLTTGAIEIFDFIHASPPCQAYSFASAKHRNAGKEYVDLVQETRELLELCHEMYNLPYVIENVVGAPLRKDLVLCGEMFRESHGLNVVRHRLFECSFPVRQPEHITHRPPITRPAKDGTNRLVKRSQYCCVAGHGGEGNSFSFDDWSAAMGINWMTKDELCQAIPPAYTEYIMEEYLNAK
jgi:DNA (cytosine-5)-methyltransferase 1